MRELATCDVVDALSATTALARLVHEHVRASLVTLNIAPRSTGGTAGLVWLRGERLVFAHAGDTRLSLFRDRTLTQMWDQHTLPRLYSSDPAATPEQRADLMRYTN